MKHRICALTTRLLQRFARRAAVRDHSATATSHQRRCQTGLRSASIRDHTFLTQLPPSLLLFRCVKQCRIAVNSVINCSFFDYYYYYYYYYLFHPTNVLYDFSLIVNCQICIQVTWLG